MTFNRDKVLKLASELTHAVARLQELAAVPKEKFLSDPHLIASAKYHFIVAIEAAIDIGNHVIAQNDLGTPEDYADVFRILGAAGAFPQEFTAELVNMAKFRNRLVHLYWNVADQELHRILTTRVDDLEKFLQYLGEFLKP